LVHGLSACSAVLARIIFQVVGHNNRFLTGYAWFVTEDVMRGVRRAVVPPVRRLADYPVGLIAVTARRRPLRPATLMHNAVRLVGRALRRYQRKSPAPPAAAATSTVGGPFSVGSSCWTDARRTYFTDGPLLYRYAAV